MRKISFGGAGHELVGKKLDKGLKPELILRPYAALKAPLFPDVCESSRSL